MCGFSDARKGTRALAREYLMMDQADHATALNGS